MKYVDGEILTLEETINRLYDYHNEDYWALPVVDGSVINDVFLAFHYVPDDADGEYDAYDEYYDVFGLVLFGSWLPHFREWVIVKYK